MQSTTRCRPAWTWLLAAGAFVAGGLGAFARPGGAPWPGTPSVLSQGANTELARARREQSLVRGESTAALWRVLEASPTLPAEEP